MFRFAVLALVAAAGVKAQECDYEIVCEYKATVSKTDYFYDFRKLCKSKDGDYLLHDAGGHDYYANVCGSTAQNCLPEGWDNNDEYGVAVQMWGDTPKCDVHDKSTLNCVDKATHEDKCCTSDCQVLGTGDPQYALMNPADPNGGVKATFRGEPPAPDDPFWCPWNPATGSQYDRTVTYFFACDQRTTMTVGEAVQNATEDCDYKLHFTTKYACGSTAKPSELPVPSYGPPSGGGGGGGLSGGWVFIIIAVSLGAVYIVGGMLYTYSTERVWAMPNRAFWSSAGEYVSAGAGFITSCGRASGGGGGGAPGKSPYSDIGAGGGGGASGVSYSGSAYNASGGTDAPASGTAYTDL